MYFKIISENMNLWEMADLFAWYSMYEPLFKITLYAAA